MAEMDKTANFRGLPIFTQLLNLLNKSKISKIPKELGSNLETQIQALN